MLKKPGGQVCIAEKLRLVLNMAATPKAHPTNGAGSDCVSLNSLYVYISFRLKQVLLDDLVSAGWGPLDIGAQDLVQELGGSAKGSLWLDGNTSLPPPSIDLVTFVSLLSFVPSGTGWPWGTSRSSRASVTFGSWGSHVSLLPRWSWDSAIGSEEVHEVLCHVAVGREDPADAGRALGPWWALDSVGHPL